jgi:protein-S-isoprenylcysteine O-methyltransferase Ste14
MLGGYVLTSLLAVSSFLLLQRQGMARDEALLAPTIASFLIYAAIVLAVFHARSAMRAWLWIIGACAPLAVLILLLLDGRTGP